MIDDQTRRYVLSVAFRFAKDLDAAEDVAQIVLIRASAAHATFRGASAPRTWLFEITKHVALGEQRRIMRRRRLLERHVTELRSPLRAGGTAEMMSLSERAASAFQASLERLPARQREIFVRSAIRGQTTYEIAARLAIEPVSVRVSLSKARRSLRSIMETTQPRLLDELRS